MDAYEWWMGDVLIPGRTFMALRAGEIDVFIHNNLFYFLCYKYIFVRIEKIRKILSEKSQQITLYSMDMSLFCEISIFLIVIKYNHVQHIYAISK